MIEVSEAHGTVVFEHIESVAIKLGDTGDLLFGDGRFHAHFIPSADVYSRKRLLLILELLNDSNRGRGFRVWPNVRVNDLLESLLLLAALGRTTVGAEPVPERRQTEQARPTGRRWLPASSRHTAAGIHRA